MAPAGADQVGHAGDELVLDEELSHRTHPPLGGCFEDEALEPVEVRAPRVSSNQLFTCISRTA
jgi:hypothetical protein